MRGRLLAALCIGLLGLGFITVTTMRAASGERTDQRPGRGAARMDRMLEKLDLSAEKQAEVTGILQAQRETMRGWWQTNGEKLRSLHQRIRAARQAGEDEKVESLRAEQKELWAEMKTLREQTDAKLAEVLTEEQVEQFGQMRRRHWRGMSARRHGRRHAMARLELTDEQSEQVRQIMSDARQKARDAESPKQRREIMQDAHKKIAADVLSEAQAEKLEKMRASRRGSRPRRMKAPELSDEQKAQALEILADAHERAADAAALEEMREIMFEAHKKVGEQVLTEEQTQRMRRARRGAGRGMGPGRCPAGARGEKTEKTD